MLTQAIKFVKRQELLDKISLIVGAAFIFYFLYILIISTSNTVRYLDDSRFFLQQFEKYWLNTKGLSKLTFFVERGHWPHPKIMGRIFTLISYYTYGYVNFKLIYILGNFSPLICLFYYLKFYTVKLRYSIPLIIACTKIMSITYWAVAIIGFGYVLCFTVASFYYLSQQKHLFSSICLFLGSFSSGIGLFLYPFAIIYLLITKKTNLKIILSHIIFYIFIVLIFYFFTLDSSFSKPKINIQPSGIDISLLLTNTIKFIGYIAQDPYRFIVGVIGFFIYILFAIKIIFSNNQNKALVFIGTFILFTAFVSAYVNQARAVSFVPYRYYIFSLHFWIILSIIISNSLNFKYSSLLLSLLILLIPLGDTRFGYYSIDRALHMKNRRNLKFQEILNTNIDDNYKEELKNSKVINKKDYNRFIKNSRINTIISQAKENNYFKNENYPKSE